MSLIQTRGVTATSPLQTQTLPSNVKDGSAPGVELISAGDEAVAGSELKGTEGSLKLSSHANSGPALGGPGGSANATSNVNYVENFVIFSDTLPAGTPVAITFKLAAGRAFRADVIQPFAVANGDAAVFGEAAVRFYSDISGGRSFRGNFGAQQVYYNPATQGMEGIFAGSVGLPEDAGEPSAGEFVATFAATVGGQFFINIETQIGATSAAFNPVESDADGQMALNWGAEVVGGLAEIRTPDGTTPFPPITNADVGDVLANLPRPWSEVPEPTSAIVLIIGHGLLMSRRLRK